MEKENKTKSIEFRVKPSLKVKIEKEAAKLQKGMSQFITDLVVKYFIDQD